MMRLAIVAAAAILAVTASQAEARARVKFRGASPTPVASQTALPQGKARPDGVGLMPAAVIGASVGSRAARARDDLPTGSTAPSGALTPLLPAGATAPVAVPATAKPVKPAFVCASERTVGAGSGFCEMN